VAYKKDIDDIRESPALDVMHLLERRLARVTYSDPHVDEVRTDSLELRSQPPEEMAARADCVLIITNHSTFDYPAILAGARLVVDTRNALKGLSSDKIVRL
jgi:UDP-N-acetyl-D-glucosamine dehydrogenase